MAVLVFATALGPAALVYGEAGLRRVRLPPTEANDSGGPHSLAWRRVATRFRRTLAHRSRPPFDAFDDLPLDWSDIPAFHREVYAALRRIPAGTTLSYGELAARAGRPGAARAVGQAMARNPWPLVIPCHRVLASDGRIGGWSGTGGVEFKRHLLELEQPAREAPRESGLSKLRGQRGQEPGRSRPGPPSKSRTEPART